MDEGVEPCGKYGECPDGTVCNWATEKCAPCGACFVCSIDEFCTANNVCEKLPDDDMCIGLECGTNEGQECGVCPDGEKCVENMCVELPEDVVVPDGDGPDVKDQPETVQPPGDAGETKQETVIPGKVCEDPCTKLFFGQCVEDLNLPGCGDDGGGGGCSCATTPPANNSGGANLLLVLVLVLFLCMRFRTVRD